MVFNAQTEQEYNLSDLRTVRMRYMKEIRSTFPLCLTTLARGKCCATMVCWVCSSMQAYACRFWAAQVQPNSWRRNEAATEQVL